ncbi:MAG TPA: glycosyltransferase [Paraburkholderia sp.]
MNHTIEEPRIDAANGHTNAAASKAACAKPRVRVLMSPYTNTTNPYIEIQKRLLTHIGYDVQPLSANSLLHGGFTHLFRAKTVLVFHWLELRPFRRKEGRTLLSLTGCLVFAFYCLVICTGRAKVVYFVHDHAVHDTVGFMRRLSMKFMACLRGLSDVRVVHAPTFERTYDAHYLPHPLYWDVPDYAATQRAPQDNASTDAQPLFAMLGTIRPYKDIAAVLDVWPQECRLDIAGNGSVEYVKTLYEVTGRRSLNEVVNIDARFLSDEEFEQRISKTDVLILPHVADSMLVSGAFFEAIGRVPMLIARATPFMVWAAKKFDNVLLFDRVDQLPELVRYAARTWRRASQQEKRALATDEFGWSACSRRYQRFFDDVVNGRHDRHDHRGHHEGGERERHQP